MPMKGYACSVIGKREMNQDSFLIMDERQLFAVADGVGGGVRGDVASQMAVGMMEKEVTEPSVLKETFIKAQKAILKEAMDTVGSPMMGTTLTTAFFKGDELFLCHVGDSRCYLYKDSCLQQLTEDQEYFDESVQATVLASYLGIPEEVYPLTIWEQKYQVSPDSRYLLCSDGLYRQMGEPQVVEIIKAHADNPQEIPKMLCERASHQEYSDNITVVYVARQ